MMIVHWVFCPKDQQLKQQQNQIGTFALAEKGRACTHEIAV